MTQLAAPGMVCVRTVTHGRGGLGRRIGQQHGSFKVLILIFYSGMKKKTTDVWDTFSHSYLLCRFLQTAALGMLSWEAAFLLSPLWRLFAAMAGRGSADVVIMRPLVHLPSYYSG